MGLFSITPQNQPTWPIRDLVEHAAIVAYDASITALEKASGIQEKTTEIDGHRLGYLESKGSGPLPTVVMLHGLFGDARHYARVQPYLKSGFKKLIALDLPGHGRSELPKGVGAIEYILSAVTRFVEQLDEPVILVGHSFGATVALEAAGLRPDLFNAVVALEPAGGKLPAPVLKQVFDKLRIDTPEKAAKFLDLTFSHHGLAYFVAGGAREELVDRFGKEATQRLLYELEARKQINERLLHRIAAPTLIVAGERDRLIPREGLDTFERIPNPNLKVGTHPDWGHAPLMEQPFQVSSMIRRFAGHVLADRFEPGPPKSGLKTSAIGAPVAGAPPPRSTPSERTAR